MLPLGMSQFVNADELRTTNYELPLCGLTNDLGHSFGGTVIAKVAEAISDRIRRLIFLNAPVLNDGERFDIQHIFGEGENVAVFGSFSVHSVKLDKTFVCPFSVFAKVKDGLVTYMQYMEDTFGTSSTFRSSGTWTFHGNPDGSEVSVP